MGPIDDGPEKTDRDGLDPHATEVRNGISHIRFAEGVNLVSLKINSSLHLAGEIAWHEGFGIVEAPFEGFLSRRLAEREDIGMAFIADQTDTSDLSFDERVGCNGCSVNNRFHLGQERFEAEAVVLGRESKDVRYPPLEVGWRGGRLEDGHPLTFFGNETVGEGTADVDAYPAFHVSYLFRRMKV